MTAESSEQARLTDEMQACLGIEAAPRITITLNVFDDDGVVVDTALVELTVEQISDIVDHAAQAILVRRTKGDQSGINSILDELDEALTISGVIGSEDNAS